MNTHSINDDEADIADLENSVSIINTSITNINNKLNNTASSALKTNIDSNSSSITTLNSQLSNSTSSTLKTNIDNNISAIASNLTIISGHTTAIGANLLARTQNASDIASNSASITTLNNAFPRETTIRQFALTSGDIYNDGKVKFYWDAANRQLRFWILDIPSGQYTVGGVERWVGTGITRVANYISQNNSTYYHYFTGPQLGGAILNSSFNLSSSYARATYFLTPYSTNDYPSYEIIVLVGYSAGYNTITIKRLI